MCCILLALATYVKQYPCDASEGAVGDGAGMGCWLWRRRCSCLGLEPCELCLSPLCQLALLALSLLDSLSLTPVLIPVGVGVGYPLGSATVHEAPRWPMRGALQGGGRQGQQDTRP